MFSHIILLLLAVPPIFPSLVFSAKHRYLDRRFYDRPPLHKPVLSRQVGNTSCISPTPVATVTNRLNAALQSGTGSILSLCPSAQYMIQAPIVFTAPNQEISTLGYPTDDTRATLVVSGTVAKGQGHTTAVDGTCGNCTGVKLRNIQINGNRARAASITGGANIEIGGANSNQLIEHVHSYDTRSWSCLHVAEGSLLCNNVVIQNNDIGPCGSDEYMQWADGISVSCRSAVVRNNVVTDATDGGIVLFGSPGTLVENNTIRVVNSILLGGINMVDYLPWVGEYTGTIVQDNTIMGGFAADLFTPPSQSDGENVNDAIIKIGIPIGPKTWFNSASSNNISHSGTVKNNIFTGAFGYAMAISSAEDFTVQGNTLVGNTSFIGSRGPNCSATDSTPQSSPFIVQSSDVTTSNLQSDFLTVQDATGLTCVVPPSGGNYWPYRVNSTL